MRYRKPKDHINKLKLLREAKILCESFEKLPFDEIKPLYVEIGMGCGDFLTEHALRFTERNYLGIERQSPLLVSAGQKIEEKKLKNVALMNIHAMRIEEILMPGRISGIFLNFSDPWSKPRYQKRRLTHIEMLRRYERIMRKGATLTIKTDNRAFFEFSLSQLAMSSFEIVRVIEGLHDEKNGVTFSIDDPILIMTEYEKKFVSLQKTIFSIECILI